MGPRPTIVIAEGKQLVAEGLRKLLEPHFEVAGIATDSPTLLRLARERKPEAIVLDLSLPSPGTAELVRRLKALVPGAALIFLGERADAVSVREAFEAGGMSYVPKEAEVSELVHGVREALHGRRFVAVPSLRKEWNRKLNSASPGPELTARQRQILKLVVRGLTGKEIAAVLRISPKTVEFHKARIIERLGVRSTAELIRYALRRGLAENG